MESATRRATGGRRAAWIAAILVAAADQATKASLSGWLMSRGSVTVIPGFLDLTLVTNTGGVFGILRDIDGPVRGLLFGLLPVAAITLMIWYARSLEPSRPWPLVGVGLILGGAAGNLIDRIRLGHVVDFVDAYLGRYHWPAFNLADSSICIGVAMLLFESLALHQAGNGESRIPPSRPPT
jgi:signal peptidase II